MSKPSIELNSLSKTFDKTMAVNNVDLTVQPGECVVLVGHNGAGKSTLVKLILGLIQPDSGSVKVLGFNVPSEAAAKSRKYIGYLPETAALYPALTGIEIMDFYADLKGVSKNQNHDLLARVGIAQVSNKRVGGYSKGMRQRLALAQALLGQPRLLLLDEPTSGLDPASRLLFYEIVHELQQAGTAILLSSHALAEMESLASRVVVMQRGIKIADDSLINLREKSSLQSTIIAKFNQLPAEIPANWQILDKFSLAIKCVPNAKAKELKIICALPALNDIEIQQPGLDAMYAHLLHREDI